MYCRNEFTRGMNVKERVVIRYLKNNTILANLRKMSILRMNLHEE